jgi:hypothetical protein
LYWDTGIQNIMTNVSVGQYLAGDQGVTLGVSRRFDNGVSMGAYVTKTSASAEQFGEGSFDKGLFVNIPFDVLLPISSSSTANLAWSPMQRDGGAKLNRMYSLYGLTSGRDRRANLFGPPRSKTLQPGADVFRLPSGLTDEWSLSDLAKDLGTSARGAGRSLFDSSTTSQWLGATGLMWLASRMDSSADDWAQNNQSEFSLKTAKAKAVAAAKEAANLAKKAEAASKKASAISKRAIAATSTSVKSFKKSVKSSKSGKKSKK